MGAPPTGETKLQFTMPIEEATRTQRAIRRLKSDPVDDELNLRLLELATKAPAGGNRQNVEFVVVRNPTVNRRLAHAFVRGHGPTGRQHRRSRRATYLLPSAFS